MTDATDLADRYVAIWNEPDPEIRARTVKALWSPDAAQLLEPPQAIRDTAASLGVAATLEARGHAALEERVTRSHEEFVERGGYAFRRRGDATRLRDVVAFRWEMVPRDGGEPAGAGLEILLLDSDGRIGSDYQLIEP